MKGAFRTCLDYSLKFQYFDPPARTCREWLSEHYPKEYPILREILPPGGKLTFSLPPSPILPETVPVAVSE